MASRPAKTSVRNSKTERQCYHCEGTGVQYKVPGSTLRRIRMKAGLTLTQAAAKWGRSVSYLSNMEKGWLRVSKAAIDFYESLEDA